MRQMAGAILFLGGIGYVLYEWVGEQRKREKRLEEMICFLHKSIFAMEVEHVRWADFFMEYSFQDEILNSVLAGITEMLRQHIYPRGETIWEKVLLENKDILSLDEEVFEIVLRAGTGFFGRNKNENILFLERSIQDLERARIKIKEKEEKKRKVFIPLGMLGGVMLIIILV